MDDDPRAEAVFIIDDHTRATVDTSLMAVQGSVIARLANLGRAQEAARLAETAHSSGVGENADGDGEGAYGLFLGSSNGGGGGGGGEGGGDSGDSGEGGGGDNGWQSWASGFAGQLETDGSQRNALDATTSYAGLAVGVIRKLNYTDLGIDGAVSFSVVTVQAETKIDSRWMNSHESGAETVFAGLALAVAPGPLQLGASLRIGTTSFDYKRHVNNNTAAGGIQTIFGSTDSLWCSVAGELGYRMEMIGDGVESGFGKDATLTPFARISHVAGKVNGYSESGALSAATIGEQDFSVTHAEVGMRWSAKLSGSSPNGKLLASLSTFFTSEWGYEAFSVAIGPDTKTFALTQLEDNGVQMTLGYEYDLSPNASLYAGGSYSSSSTGTNDFSVGLSLKISF